MEHQEAQTAFLDQLEALLTVCTHFDDDQLLAASRCRGSTVGDVLVHVHLGLQDMLLGMVWPVDADPDTDAASYWRSTVPTNDPQADQVAGVRFVRLLGAAYRRPTGLVGHLRPTAEGVARAVLALPEGALRFQGHVLSTGDFLATWAVELTVHHFDLGLELEIASPAPCLWPQRWLGMPELRCAYLIQRGVGSWPYPERRSVSINGLVEQLSESAGIPIPRRSGKHVARPGFYIPPERSEWFSRVLARTSAAGLLAFVGDRCSARELLTPRQQRRVGSDYTLPGTDAVFDAEVRLANLSFVGTDHVFRFGSQWIEASSEVLVGLRRYLVAKDFVGYQRALPQVLGEWLRRRGDAERDWGGQNRVGVVAMDSDGALLALRPVGVGTASLEYATLG